MIKIYKNIYKNIYKTNSKCLSILYKLSIFLAGAISVFAFAPLNYWELNIITIFCWIWIVTRHNDKPSTLFYNSYILGLGFFFANLYWTYICLHEVINLNMPISIMLHALFAIFLAVYVALSALIYRWIKRSELKYTMFNYLVLLPSCWVLSEMLRGKLFSGFSWYNLSYIAMNANFMKGLFPIGGEYLVSWVFLSFLAGIFLFCTCMIKKDKQHGLASSILLYLVAIVLLGSKISTIQYTTLDTKTIKVALIQGNNSVKEKWDMEYVHALLNKYAQMVADARSADLIIMPETAIATFPSNLPPYYLEDMLDLAKHSQIIIGMPLPLANRGEDYSNAAILLNNFNFYAKQHLVPYGEYIPLKSVLGKFYKDIALPMVNFQADPSHKQALSINGTKAAFNLCYENGFGEELLEQGRSSQFMINLSDMVWYKDTWAKDHHLQMSIARTLENQRYWVQDTNSGLTAIIDPAGKIVAQLAPNTQNILFYSVPLMHGFTPYQRIGDRLINGILIITLLWGVILKLGIKKKAE